MDDLENSPPAPAPDELERALARLSDDERCALAADPTGDPATLAALGRDATTGVRALVAANPASTADLLERLADDETPEVRSAVAAHPHAAPGLLHRLVADSEPDVRISVAFNARTMPADRAHLLADARARVRQAALYRLIRDSSWETLPNVAVAAGPLESASFERRVLAASDPALPVPLLEASADSADEGVRAAVAANPSCPAERLEVLAGAKSSASVLVAAASNPSASPDVLRRLARSKNFHVLVALGGNPALPEALLPRLLGHRWWAVRWGVAGSPHLRHDQFEQLVTDVAPIRLRLAANPATPPDVVDALVSDREVWVRGVALSHPAVLPDTLRSAAGDLDQPAWLLHGVAANPNCPDALRDEIEAWTMLGGGAGDPGFDPVTCLGHPADPAESPAVVAFERLGKGRRLDDPHPLHRSRPHQGLADEPHTVDVGVMLRDPEPAVRLTVLRQHRRALDQGTCHRLVRDDPEASIVSLAEAQLRMFRNQPMPRWAKVLAGFAVVLLIGAYAASRSEPTGQIPSFPAVSGTPLGTIDFDSLDFDRRLGLDPDQLERIGSDLGRTTTTEVDGVTVTLRPLETLTFVEVTPGTVEGIERLDGTEVRLIEGVPQTPQVGEPSGAFLWPDGAEQLVVIVRRGDENIEVRVDRLEP